jgi:hypothetical protein
MIAKFHISLHKFQYFPSIVEFDGRYHSILTKGVPIYVRYICNNNNNKMPEHERQTRTIRIHFRLKSFISVTSMLIFFLSVHFKESKIELKKICYARQIRSLLLQMLHTLFLANCICMRLPLYDC